MSSITIDEIEKKEMKTEVADIRVGDTVVVSKQIIEGQKKRIQKFEGVIIKIQGKYSRLSFTVRKVIDKIGVEKSFLLHSETVPNVDILRRGKVRRARLHYLRERIGSKATRIKAKS